MISLQANHRGPFAPRPRSAWGALSCAAVPFLLLVTAAPLSAQAPAPGGGEVLWQGGQQAHLAGRYDEAISTFGAYLKLHPRSASAMVALGFSHFKKGELEAAEKLYKQALKVNDCHAGAGYGLGQLAMEKRNWAEAERFFRDLLRLAPGFEPVRARHNLALSLFALKRRSEAAPVFEEALRHDAPAHYAQLYRDALDNEIARRSYNTAARWGEQGAALFPQDAWIWNKLAWALKMSGERRASRAAYARAEAIVYPDATPRHKTVLSLPFRGKWRVTQGNDGYLTHRGLGARFAWDFQAVAEDGSSSASFGQDVLAPADGRVVALLDGTPDNTANHADPSPYSGNYVLIEHAPGEFTSLGHLQNGSVEVKVGQEVKRGQRVARCGNSGHTSQPHLHFSFIGLHDGSRVSQPGQFSNYLLHCTRPVTVPTGVPTEGSIVENAPAPQ
jgi:murein DD-endopeptidase MepM/ murein hydrolase activator NlpD